MESDPEQAYRRAMGAFVTGVTVVTASNAGVVSGMTVNSLTSVSLSPRLLLWCLGDQSTRYGTFAEAENWGVAVLGAGDVALARRFAQAELQDVGRDEIETFAGAPVLRAGVAQLACRTHDRIRAGDHLIIVGEVLDLRTKPGAALTFYRGQYGELDTGTWE